MFTTSRLSILCLIACILIGSSLPLVPAQAEVVYHVAPPAKKITKKTKKQKRFRAKKVRLKKVQKKPDNIVVGLYITFGLLFLLPLLVIIGSLLVGLGFPILLNYILGSSLIGIGNIGAILAGALTGANRDYSTQALLVAVWIMFGLNLAALLAFVLLYTLVFVAAPALLFLIIGLGLLSLIFLVWGIIIARQKAAFNKASQLEEE